MGSDLPDRVKFWDDDHIGTVIDAWLNGVLRSRDEMDVKAAEAVLEEFLRGESDATTYAEMLHKAIHAAWGETE